MSLNKRLLEISRLVPKGSCVADIGTDHAYLPVYLIKNEIAKYVIACDIKPGPLSLAQKNVKNSGLSRIDLRLSDGLDAVKENEVDTIIIAGMGGEMISRILQRALWIKNSRYNLILQPMSSAYNLREFLCNAGFEIISERAVSSANRLYTIIQAGYTGINYRADPLFLYLGKLSEKVVGNNRKYIAWINEILKKQAKDISTVYRKKSELETLNEVIKKIDNLLEGD